MARRNLYHPKCGGANHHAVTIVSATPHLARAQEWWERQRPLFECFVSAVVLEEAQAGEPEMAAQRLAQLTGVAALEITPETTALVHTILRSGVMPPKAARDAAHVAIAAVSAVDYVLTWNCRHLANAQIRRSLKTVVEQAGYAMPTICTPAELMGAEGESGHV